MKYRIEDEPGPSALEQAIVDPRWPLLASMFAGGWLAFPWFVVNAFALGGKRRFGDLGIALVGLLVNAGLLMGGFVLLYNKTLSQQHFAYLLLVPLAIRLGLFYVLFLRQATQFELFQYFGGAARSGVLIVVAGALLRSRVLDSLPAALQVLLS